MRERNKRKIGKEVVIVALLCLICLSAIAVGNHFLGGKDNSKSENSEDIINLNAEKKEEETSEEDSNVAVDGNVIEESDSVSSEETKSLEEETLDLGNVNTDVLEGVSEKSAENSENAEDEQEVVNVNSTASNLNFTEEDKIDWPVEGNVLLDYSMENTIYFPTLDTYKCNPAIIIQSEKGTEVKAGIKGVVKEVSTEDEIGNYTVIEIGNGYELTYGQLSDIKVSVGDNVEAETCIGLIADTTRYYENEGTNLYLKMTKNGEPCDPMDYLK